MCGPSAAQTSISKDQSNFFNQLSQNYGTEFAGQQSILNSLNGAFSGILGAGINQQGFSPAENAALNTQAINTTGANYRAAAQATNEQLAGRGGGNAYLPSGVNAQITGSLAGQAAGQLSSEENQITQANYQQGRENFLNAATGLSGAAQLENPSAGAANASNAGNNAFQSATAIYNQGNAWQGALGGVLGGALSGLSGGIGAGLGKKIGG